VKQKSKTFRFIPFQLLPIPKSYCILAIFVLLLQISITSCGIKTKQDDGLIVGIVGKCQEKGTLKIDPRKFGKKSFTLANIASETIYIPLSNKVKIGSINTLRITENAIYLSSGGTGANNHSLLFKFDKKGKDPIIIGGIGRGPGEYLLGDYFAVDEKNNKIYISSSFTNSIQVFTTFGGFLREIKIRDLKVGNIELLGSGYLFIEQKKLGAQTPYLWAIVDTLGNIASYKNNTCLPFRSNIGARDGFSKYKDDIIYWVDYNDTIFKISPNLEWHVLGTIVPGDYKRPHKYIPITPDFLEKRLQYYSPHTFFETKHYILSRYNYQNRYAYVVLEKKNYETFINYFEWSTNTQGGIMNNIDGGLPFSPIFYYIEGNTEYLAGAFNTFQLKHYVASAKFKETIPKYPEKKKALEKLANSLDENDNPVLMLVKLKE